MTTSKVINQKTGTDWVSYNADCVDVAKSLPTESIDLTVTSCPYSNLYCYSGSERDMGNSRTDEEFQTHFRVLIDELFRITKKGRIVAIDCMNIPAMKSRDGYIGLKDFRGDIIRQFLDAGFIFHSEHCAWKDPLLEATRTKAIGLMHKQLCKDSSMVRAGIPQYILAFRIPGENAEPIAHEKGLEWFSGENPPKNGVLSHERWRRYASPVWMDIDFTRTLNGRCARENQDERHICPMALDLIERCVHLWSNPKDVIYDPFSGVGSTGFIAMQLGRRFIGSELKTSYWEQGCKNIEHATSINYGLFSNEESDDNYSDELEQ
jgi:DNA modification methylase